VLALRRAQPDRPNELARVGAVGGLQCHPVAARLQLPRDRQLGCAGLLRVGRERLRRLADGPEAMQYAAGSAARERGLDRRALADTDTQRAAAEPEVRQARRGPIRMRGRARLLRGRRGWVRGGSLETRRSRPSQFHLPTTAKDRTRHSDLAAPDRSPPPLKAARPQRSTGATSSADSSTNTKPQPHD